jgi:hypothetical protein
MMKKVMRKLLFCLALTAVPVAGEAQSPLLELPLQSQSAEVSQTIGLTEITIRYHRPEVNDRKIWGGVARGREYKHDNLVQRSGDYRRQTARQGHVRAAHDPE